MPYSERLQEVLDGPDGILKGVSGNKAALRVAESGGELSNTTIIDLKKGQYGRLESVRALAHAYAARILKARREEITEAYGDDPARTDEAWLQLAEDWLCAIADSAAYRSPRAKVEGDQLGEVARLAAEKAISRLMEQIGDQVRGNALAQAEDTPEAWVAREMARLAREYDHPHLEWKNYDHFRFGVGELRALTWAKARGRIQSMEAALKEERAEIAAREARDAREPASE